MGTEHVAQIDRELASFTQTGDFGVESLFVKLADGDLIPSF